MSDLKTTPGPWAIDYPSIYAPALGIRSGRVAAVSIAHKDTKTYEANAQLIAAAPALYEALADLMENPLYQTAVGGNPNMVDRLIERANAALAKARGDLVNPSALGGQNG